MDLNKVMLIGNVGADPEFHDMKGGGELAKFSVATTRKWRKDGQLNEDTSWHNIVVFNPYVIKAVRDFVRKGTRVYIEGEIKKRSYEKDGVTQWITEIIVPQIRGDMILLGKSRGESQSSGEGRATSSTPQHSSDDFDDDIPF